MKFLINNEEVEVKIIQKTGDKVEFELDGKSYLFNLKNSEGDRYFIEGNGKTEAINVSTFGSRKVVQIDGVDINVEKVGLKRSGDSAQATGGLVSPMPGKIFKILKSQGEQVAQGEVILILEAMKMEHAIKANKDSVVKEIFFKEGELVDGGVELVSLEDDE